MKKERNKNNPLNIEEIVMGILTIISIAIGLWLSSIVAGCTNTASGVKVVASSATYTNIGDINWDEYKIPILSVYLGPKAIVWVHKDYAALTTIEIGGVVTNTTSALGIYDSNEEKHLHMKMEFKPASTNAVIIKGQ